MIVKTMIESEYKKDVHEKLFYNVFIFFEDWLVYYSSLMLYTFKLLQMLLCALFPGFVQTGLVGEDAVRESLPYSWKMTLFFL